MYSENEDDYLDAIRIVLSIILKEQMGIENILDREYELNSIVFKRLSKVDNLIVKLLNDRFGIQKRSGCSCAGTYGHYLLHVDQLTSKAIEKKYWKVAC
ncbi:hypothetical protein [Polaribacter sp. Asnod1-A03]|uniref:hypothetical protein n=1 Tax=Polaribacter sp. Asnod1-A03 TaxID=3160581 RepID=UPI00386C68DF